MANVEQQAVETFRENLKAAWDRKRAQEQEVLKAVEEALSAVRGFLDGVRRAAEEITENEIHLDYSEPKFELLGRRVSETYTFSGFWIDPVIKLKYSVELTYFAQSVLTQAIFYEGKKFTSDKDGLRSLLEVLRDNLLDAFCPR
jgi:hypothetical protein